MCLIAITLPFAPIISQESVKSSARHLTFHPVTSELMAGHLKQPEAMGKEYERMPVSPQTILARGDTSRHL